MLGLPVRFKVGHAHVGVCNWRAHRARGQVCGYVGERLSVESHYERLYHPAQPGRIVVVLVRAVTRLPYVVHFASLESENENILVADCLSHFNVRAVERTYGERAVYHELHVAGAAGFFTRKRDLFGYFRCGHELFRHGDVVVFHVHDVQLFVYLFVFLYIFGKEIYQFYDILCHLIPLSRLCTEDISLWLNVEVGIFPEIEIGIYDVQSVEQLTLIFVETLCLNVEQRLGIDEHALLFEGILCKLLLFDRLYLAEAFKHALVVFELFEVFEHGRV